MLSRSGDLPDAADMSLYMGTVSQNLTAFIGVGVVATASVWMAVKAERVVLIVDATTIRLSRAICVVDYTFCPS